MNPPSTCLSTVPNRDHFALFAAIFNGKYLVLEKQGVLMKLYICEGIQTGQRAPQQGSTSGLDSQCFLECSSKSGPQSHF